MVDDRDPDRIRAVRRSLAALLATVVAACGAGDATDGVVERDSAGVRIVESTLAAADREAGWSLSSELALEIGGDYVLGTARDELEVERVRLYELRGG